MSLTLIEITPNYYGPDRWFLYDGDLASASEVSKDTENPPDTRGWLVRFRDIRFAEHCAAVFVDDGKIFADFGQGPVEASSGGIEASMKRFLNVSVISVRPSAGQRETFVVVTPPWRYLSNDGRFPGSVEPICELVSVLTDAAKADSFRESMARSIEAV